MFHAFNDIVHALKYSKSVLLKKNNFNESSFHFLTKMLLI